jgi:glycosyltransferase involved in cell wall biosynthesis
MDGIKVSVVIISYNHFDFIKQAIDSVLMQTISFDLEIIIADDCSDDHTQDILTEYRNNYPKLINLILRDKNVGTTKNLCGAFEKCKGKYITCLAGDDYWIDTKKLQIQYDWLEEHPDYIGVSHIVESRNNEGIARGRYPTSKVIGQNATIGLFLKGISYSTGSTMFRNIFTGERAGDYINLIIYNRLVEDVSLAIILLDAGKIYVMDKCMSVYRIGRNRTGNYNSIRTSIQKLVDHMELYDANERFFLNRYNFTKLKSIALRNSFLGCATSNNLPLYYTLYKKLPFKAKFLLIFSIPIYVVQIFARKGYNLFRRFFNIVVL